MLKKINRLKSRGDFKRTLAGRRVWINDCFVVYGLRIPVPNSSDGALGSHFPRLGFIVSKKVHAKSTSRNLVKRRLRELLRVSLREREGQQTFHRYKTLVFIARQGVLNATFQILQQKMTLCLKNI